MPAAWASRGKRAREPRAKVDHGHGRAGGVQIERGPIGAIVVGQHDRAPAGEHGLTVEIAADRAGQHDARAVVAGEHQRPLERAGREHDLPGPDLPEPLAGQVRGRGRPQVVGDPLDQGEVVVVVVAECRGAGQHAKLRQGLELGPNSGEPGGRWMIRPARRAARRRAAAPARPAARARRRGRRQARPPGPPGPAPTISTSQCAKRCS